MNPFFNISALFLNTYKLKLCPRLLFYHKLNKKLMKDEGKLLYCVKIVYIQEYTMTFLFFASADIFLHLYSMSLFTNI